MLPFFKNSAAVNKKSIDWITYATQQLRQAEQEGELQLPSYAIMQSNTSNSHGQIPDPALYGSSAALGKH
ncbi:hypothetical protein SAMN04515668_4065 [Hymenobacter arizonensis]|uniref:Uncharacterized protein n=1 Tax=Hymenobacter arizonensis TaxID=1227077 RepID=A0A1I6AZ02_HYMAR|nr:hypothetical protein SAMN04515668_4065 [Hymenobacter arizonensis]